MSHHDLDTLKHLDDVLAALLIRGALKESIPFHEQAISIRSQIYGTESTEVMLERLEVARIYNKLALSILHEPATQSQDQLDCVRKYLKMAELMTEPHSNMPQEVRLDLRATTLNNLTCLFKKEGKLRAALQCAHKALKIQKTCQMAEAQAASLLNIAALNSSLGKHELALSSAEAALDTVLALEDAAELSHASALMAAGAGGDETAAEVLRPASERTQIYYAPLQVMCYTNIGTELEHLQRWDRCLEAYQAAYQLSFMAMGSTHPLTQRCQRSFSDVYALSMQRPDGKGHASTTTKLSVRPGDTLHSLSALHSKNHRLAAGGRRMDLTRRNKSEKSR